MESLNGMAPLTSRSSQVFVDLVSPNGCRHIHVPGGVKKAESCVFSDCPELKKVHLPMSLKEIEEEKEEFNSCPNVTIYAPAGSEAEALQNGAGSRFRRSEFLRKKKNSRFS